MIHLTCTTCLRVLEIDDAFAGGACRCEHCGTIQTVPAHRKAKTRSPAPPPPRVATPDAATERPREEMPATAPPMESAPPAAPPSHDAPKKGVPDTAYGNRLLLIAAAVGAGIILIIILVALLVRSR